MGKVFEEICKQYLWKQLLDGKCPIAFSSLGRWWGNNPAEKSQAEIDIVAQQDKDTALFGACKWTNEKVDLGVLETRKTQRAVRLQKDALLSLCKVRLHKRMY